MTFLVRCRYVQPEGVGYLDEMCRCTKNRRHAKPFDNAADAWAFARLSGERVPDDCWAEEETMADREFVLKIKLGNDAMQTGADIRKALDRVSKSLLVNLLDHEDITERNGKRAILDENGNTVGSWEFKDANGS